MSKKDPLKSRRIFVGFNSAGAAGIWSFTRVLRRRGYQIDFYGMGEISFNMPVDFLLKFSDYPLRSFIQRFIYFFKILPKYNVWHFNYMEVFFFYPLNLLILRILGKKIVCTFRGSEVRSKLRMKIFCFLADEVVLTGPFLVKSVDRYDIIIPYARNVQNLITQTNKSNNQKLTVLHAPSNSKVKGTLYVEKVFKHLNKLYPQVEFKIVEGLNHDALLNEMIKADIVIDQLLIGWYGGLAVEAMAMGKVVMAFLDTDYFQFVDFGSDLPIINTNIWTLKRDLEMLINHTEDFKRFRIEGMKFARKYHDSKKIAEKYLTIYRGSDE
ncbi:MAG: hypothetical protein US31_C0002G0090 [Berkelbacteria bacterium GW2011_GWA1_36_9]|uniref:Glycosyltransferase n=1 Tax=Berkelbacteria bacterium GW2011_GWA1_36_9 TaxID=1618331 RepID=A0A0G0FY76_9BACT|nr:MAG: hypothetical protein US31_C0002G0090 [Berkelbacteria bacterium GW2011_GWA1_36_9]